MKDEIMIAELRKKKGWTQNILAEKCGLSIRTIQRLEAGDDASISTLSLIASALNVDIEDLFKSISSNDKKNEILNYTELKKEQIKKRKYLQNFYEVANWIFILIMLLLSPMTDSDDLGLIWAFMWPIGFMVLKAINQLWYQPFLERKYPLTKGVHFKKYYNS